MSTSQLFVIGFDGSSGTKRAGRADSTALVMLPMNAPATPRVVGYWEDDGTPGWTPPRPTVITMVDTLLSEPACVGMASDTAGWGEELATWQGAHGSRMRPSNRRFTMTAPELKWAWQLLHENISQQVIRFDEAAPDYRLFEEHILAMRLDDAGRIDKAHGGPSAGRIDVGAALSHACFARNRYLGSAPRSTEPEPAWPKRLRGDMYAGAKPKPTNVRCALPGCDQFTASHFCTEDHLALYRARWPESKQITRHGGKLVAAVDTTADDRAAFTRWWKSGEGA